MRAHLCGPAPQRWLEKALQKLFQHPARVLHGLSAMRQAACKTIENPETSAEMVVEDAVDLRANIRVLVGELMAGALEDVDLGLIEFVFDDGQVMTPVHGFVHVTLDDHRADAHSTGTLETRHPFFQRTHPA